ncbi:hypothetical protein Kpol_1066p51 [Vanderwaltozyma polyspora DSM 70294]|uniref:Uncharacterized protein n=1 Tax=Vanderwaltozyma polyspora (strain ATCC 22028 / DSM 70294 / BCRC 21397 / CBS 2163 / NBRC 10782 / NRRL Y-8283 / UCD 57-17) TaxID=436907 RepID=A7TMR9_VANPO|nr:uncharacterized protein Kpol_1066p51 [Vanderwaltozyma polyspora DSM 70294]EDO16483.1 hypothetical protein Kpol_1066p51 [Vanderwaltozyma polyspora DSM 70294]
MMTKNPTNGIGNINKNDSQNELIVFPNDSTNITHNEEVSMNLMNPNNLKLSDVTAIKIDNLPPGKTWKQIKYLIGGIIHHSNVLQIKLLPPLTSIVPPFVTFQSCIVTLKHNLDNDQLNHLIFTLNTYQWDYYNLFAYILSPLEYNSVYPNQSQIQPHLMNPNIMNPPSQPHPHPHPHPHSAQNMHISPGHKFNTQKHSSPGTLSINNAQPNNFLMHKNMMNFIPPMMPPPMAPMFGMPAPTLSRKQYHQKTFMPSEPNESVDTSNLPLNKRKRDSILKLVNETAAVISDLDISNKSTNQSNNNKKKLRQIFNERSFRRQMTNRGMWQFQLTNFPPYLQPDTELKEDDIPKEKLDSISLCIETKQIEKYCRLRWTVLKDFIKLKCLKLLNSEENIISKNSPMFNEELSVVLNELSPNASSNNTREFYVGVYEDHEELAKVKLKPIDDDDDKITIKYMNGTIYKAIIGFHDKEFYDLCIKSLSDEEYSFGYKLKLMELPPYTDPYVPYSSSNSNDKDEEEQSESKDVASTVTSDIENKVNEDKKSTTDNDNDNDNDNE